MPAEPHAPPPPRDAERRRHDHAEIHRLADSVLPDLMARLAASGLGELEVREDHWRIRLRRPAPPRAGLPDRPPDRSAERVERSTRPIATDAGPAPEAAGPGRVMATSPAVGVFQPRADIRPGARVRSGDRLGIVDLLGLPQDVVAPDDGTIVAILSEAGEGVEYGQDLVEIEPAPDNRYGTDAPGPTPPAGDA
jgi:biotin carboxyl carrier protein